MYIPAHFAGPDDALAELLDRAGLADLVSVGPDGLAATPLPLLYDPATGGDGALLGHVARNNPHWHLDGAPSMVIVRGPDAYVSPSWYPSKAEHGRVVPTWNYLTVHVHGRLVVHDDPVWVEALVRRLTDRHEAGRRPPWSPDDAPPRYLAGQLRAIVGVEVAIERVEAKYKLSQNRSEADVAAVSAALGAGSPAEQAVAAAMNQPG
ncbi:MAG: FMN-binding negative transcriptional regulator [Actinomycetota bacterium]|nr:FMN-binding negative transcriptional regulator [Actinomycetota bacterium]